MPTSDRSAWIGSLLLSVAACSGSPDAASRSQMSTHDASGVMVPCARGDAPLAARCEVERATTPDGPVLTLRSHDGGFRRLLVVGDGRGLVAADGAQPASVAVIGAGLIEVRVGGDRYRLPATVAAPHQ